MFPMMLEHATTLVQLTFNKHLTAFIKAPQTFLTPISL